MPSVNCGFDDNPQGRKGDQMLAVYGPTLWADIGFDSNYKLGQIPVPGIKSVEALVDTGQAKAVSTAYSPRS